MKQFEAPENLKLDIDFERPGIPLSATILQPVLFKDGNDYCCVYGANIENGISGRGETPEKALQDWDKNLEARRKNAPANDELAQFINKTMDSATDKPHTGQGNGIVNEGSVQTAKMTQGLPTDDAGGRLNTVTQNSRKNTTDQANADGSE